MTPTEVHRSAPGAATTRNRLIQAAQACFLESGYSQTTTKNIADQAGVTERTLFNNFPSKADLFRDAVAAAVSQLDGQARVRDMAEVRELGAAPDLDEFLASFSSITARLHERSAPYAAMTLQAAAADDAAAELWRWGKGEQEKDIRAVLSLMVKRGWLSQSQADNAVDAAVVLTSHETYAQLCLERGWAQDRYTGFLIAHLSLQIRRELTTAARQ